LLLGEPKMQASMSANTRTSKEVLQLSFLLLHLQWTLKITTLKASTHPGKSVNPACNSRHFIRAVLQGCSTKNATWQCTSSFLSFVAKRIEMLSFEVWRSGWSVLRATMKSLPNREDVTRKVFAAGLMCGDAPSRRKSKTVCLFKQVPRLPASWVQGHT
jgi:hypothetical protein